jgi:iron complex outermembrane receptor protein
MSNRNQNIIHPRNLIMTRFRSIAFGAVLFCSATWLATAPPAFAADATADSKSDGDSDSLGEIVVSAAKRDGTVQNTPVSISVVSDQQIAQLDLETVHDIEHVMPNVGYALVTGTPQLYIRGVGGGGRNVGFDPRVGVYVDGVYIGNTASLDTVLVGLERVEVLRGPQGFLFGAASDAGAISLVTKAPNNTFSEEASIAYGSHNQISFTDRVNFPIKDNIFGTFSLVRETGDGWIRNLAEDGRYADKIDNIGARGRIRIVVSDNTTVDLAADYFHTETDLLVGEPITGPFGTGVYPYGNYTVDQTAPELDRRSGGGVSATVAYSDAEVKFTSITAYRTSHRQWDTDTDHTPLNLLSVAYGDQYDTFSQEFTLTSNVPSSRLRYLAGLYYSTNTESSNRTATIGSDAATFGLGSGYLIVTPSDLESTYSAYGSLDYDIEPNLTFDVGGRVTMDTRQLTASQVDTTTLLAGPDFTGFVGNLSETYFLPTAGLTYKAADDVMIYGKFSEGEKPGGYDADFVLNGALTPRPYEYSAEKVKSYEAGVKSQWFERRLTANVSAFLNNFDDYQLFTEGTTPEHGVYSSLKNAGKVRTDGLEFEFDAIPTKGLTMGLNFSRLYATYVSFPNGGGIGVSWNRHQLEYAPKWTGSLNANYTQEMSLYSGAYWVVGGNFYMRSSSYADPSNLAEYYLSSSKLLSARLGFGSKGTGFEWEVTLSGENLLNSDSYTNISQDGFGVLVGFREIPRRYMGKFSIKF